MAASLLAREELAGEELGAAGTRLGSTLPASATVKPAVGAPSRAGAGDLQRCRLPAMEKKNRRRRAGSAAPQPPALGCDAGSPRPPMSAAVLVALPPGTSFDASVARSGPHPSTARHPRPRTSGLEDAIRAASVVSGGRRKKMRASFCRCSPAVAATSFFFWRKVEQLVLI